MRKFLSFLLVLIFGIQSAFAGVGSHQAKVAGSSIITPPTNSEGFLDSTDLLNLIFKYKAGKNTEKAKFPEGQFALPYKKIDRLIYGETKHLRVGQTIALAALAGAGGLLLLLSKSHTHFLTIEYRDDSDHQQVIDFEVGKGAIKPLIQSLEVRTGKKTEYEARSAKANQTSKKN